MAGDISGRVINPGTKLAPKDRVRCIANEALSRWSICAEVGVQGELLKLGLATSVTAARGMLYISINPVASGKEGLFVRMGVISGVNTAGQAVGNPVYLGTAGGFNFTGGGSARKVGTVLKVGTTDGEISFNGAHGGGTMLKVGVAAVAGAASVTVTGATLGGTFGGKPAFAMCATVSGVIHATACTWTGDDLVITFSAAYTGNVNYFIAVE